MMAIHHYTKEQLHALRLSPLVKKPDNLPAIEQWLEYVYADPDSREKLRIPHSEAASSAQQQQNQGTGNGSVKGRQVLNAKAGGDASPMGSFGAGLRPSLGGRGRTGEDVALGPPRTMFPSSRNAKLSELAGEKGAGDATSEDPDSMRRGMFRERGARKDANEKDGNHMKGSWTSARDRRQAGDDGLRQENRFNRRNGDQDGESRTADGRWGRDDKRQGDRTSWRDREAARKEHAWGRDAPTEKEPEWMDNAAPPGGEDDLFAMGMHPRTQEDFQQWMETMKKKGSAEEPLEEPPPVKEAMPANSTTTLKLEGITDKPFGGWGDAKSSSAGALDSAKSAQPKTKSRFASVFAQPRDEPTAEPQNTNGSAEDAAGFQNIMAMLNNANMSPAVQTEGPSSPPPAKSNGTKQKSRFTGFFDQTPKSPEKVQSLPEAGYRTSENEMIQSNRGVVDEPNPMFGARLPDFQAGQQSMGRPTSRNPMSPETMQSQPDNRNQQQQPPQSHPNDLFLDQPPSRGTATPDLAIQNLLQRAQRPESQDKTFLLNLLQTKGSSRPASQQARPDSNFGPLWIDQPANAPEPHAPKPRAPAPPGLFEDQLLRNNGPDTMKQEMPQQMPGMDMPQRRTSQRAPPGFYDEQSLFLHQQQQQAQAHAAQRRTFGEPSQQHQMQPGRRMSGHPNLPQLPMPNLQQQYPSGPPPPPEFLQSPGAPPQQGPPPGFNPHMRIPPGLHNMPNLFPGPQQPQQAPPQGRDPPGFPSMPPMQSPPAVPPGFFGGPQGPQGPPGYMQMRSPMGAPMPPNGRGPFDGGFDGHGMGGPRR